MRGEALGVHWGEAMDMMVLMIMTHCMKSGHVLSEALRASFANLEAVFAAFRSLVFCLDSERASGQGIV